MDGYYLLQRFMLQAVERVHVGWVEALGALQSKINGRKCHDTGTLRFPNSRAQRPVQVQAAQTVRQETTRRHCRNHRQASILAARMYLFRQILPAIPIRAERQFCSWAAGRVASFIGQRFKAGTGLEKLLLLLRFDLAGANLLLPDA